MRRQLLSFVSTLPSLPPCPRSPAEIETTSQIDAVTVYPDSAMVTRLIRLDLPAGDSTLLAQDFPLTLDPSSLRVEGEGGARLVIGAVEARPPLPQPAANLPEIDRRHRGAARRAHRARRRDRVGRPRAASSPSVLPRRRPPASAKRARRVRSPNGALAFAAVAEEIATADNAIRDARIKQRDIDREIARLEAERNATPPKKLEVRIDLNADAAAPALLRVTYAVRGARWTPLYDARLDTGSKDRKPSLELVRRAEIVQTTGEDWADVALVGLDRAHRARRQRARAAAADRALSGRRCDRLARRRSASCRGRRARRTDAGARDSGRRAAREEGRGAAGRRSKPAASR